MNNLYSIAEMVVEAALDEKAFDLTVLDVGDITVIADYFVIASGRSVVQIRSIADNVEKKLEEAGIVKIRREGYQQGKWVVLDFGSVIFHVFRQEEREYYNLETLWGDAKKIEYKEEDL